MVFGLAVHWRIYPVVYALPIALCLGKRSSADCSIGNGDTSSIEIGGSFTNATRWASLRRTAQQLLSADVLIFGLVSVTVVLGLGLVFFQLYGWEFIQVRASQRRFPLPQVRVDSADDTSAVCQLGGQGENRE